MFPYGAIIASQLLHKQTPYVPKPPKISTLGDYTETSPEDIYKLLTNRGTIAGIMEMCDIISNWQGFDNLSDVKKRSFLHKYAPIGCIKNKPTIFELIKDLF